MLFSKCPSEQNMPGQIQAQGLDGERPEGPGPFQCHKDPQRSPDRSRAELVTPRHRPAERMTAVIRILKRMQHWSGPRAPTPVGGVGKSGVMAGGRATHPRVNESANISQGPWQVEPPTHTCTVYTVYIYAHIYTYVWPGTPSSSARL